MAYLFLIIAIIFEVAGALSLRMATSGSKKKGLWLLAVLGGYGIAFFGITMALVEGLALGVAYGIWAASGVALTAVLSRILFKEPLTKGDGGRYRPDHRRGAHDRARSRALTPAPVAADPSQARSAAAGASEPAAARCPDDAPRLSSQFRLAATLTS